MKICFVCIALLYGRISFGQDFSNYLKREYKNSSGALPYRILYPENYDKSIKYPVILFLHGAGERGSDNNRQLLHGGTLFLTAENRKRFPCFVIAPQCPADGYWSSVSVDRSKTPLGLVFDYGHPASPAMVMAIEIVKEISKHESVDPARFYVVGLSMGGMGTFEAVYRNPGLFAAAAPICGGGDTKAYDQRVLKTAFWIFHGDQDKTVDVSNSRNMVARLRELGAQVRYTEYPGVYHNSWDNAFAEPGLMEWLFEKKG